MPYFLNSQFLQAPYAQSPTLYTCPTYHTFSVTINPFLTISTSTHHFLCHLIALNSINSTLTGYSTHSIHYSHGSPLLVNHQLSQLPLLLNLPFPQSPTQFTYSISFHLQLHLIKHSFASYRLSCITSAWNIGF